MKKFLKTLICFLPILIAIAGCDLPFGNDDDDTSSDNKISIEELNGTWVLTNPEGSNESKRTISGNTYFYYSKNVTDPNNYTEEECNGTITKKSTDSTPKNFSVTFTTMRTRTTSGGTTGEWSSWGTINSTDTKYYKIENSFWYSLTNTYNASWTGAKIYKKN